MADLYGKGFQKAFINVPQEKYDRGNFATDMKVFVEEFDLEAAIAQNDILHLTKLTKQGRIVGGFLKSDDMGANGAFKLGIVGADDCLIPVIDASTGSGNASTFNVNGVALGEVLDENAEVILTCTETTTATSGSIKLVLFIAEP